jgi:hypothetical protein
VRFIKKTHFFAFFLLKNLHISKICCTFAPDFKKEKKRSPTLGSGKPADLGDRKGTRKVPQGYNLATDRVPDFLK